VELGVREAVTRGSKESAGIATAGAVLGSVR
jgi:hypothetical protein